MGKTKCFSIINNNIKFKVVKNKIASIAAKNTNIQSIVNDFSGSTTIAWGNNDFVAATKTLINIQKSTKIKIKTNYIF